MDTQESIPEKDHSNARADEVVFTSGVRQEPIEAEIITEESCSTAEIADGREPGGQTVRSRRADVEPENLAAMGGTVGANVLGLLALVGAFISAYAAITGLIGLAMGIWGLNSSHKKWAAFGMVVCGVAIALAVVLAAR